jgi:hypothetical protein
MREIREMLVSFVRVSALNVSDPSGLTIATYGVRKNTSAKSRARAAAPIPIGLPAGSGSADRAIITKIPTNTGTPTIINTA